METIKSLLQDMERENAFGISANDPTLQFENGGENLLFSTLLPERSAPKNIFRDAGIRFKTMIANDGTRYSPPQKKNAMLLGSAVFELCDADAAGEMNMQFYEEFIRTLDRNDSQQGAFQLLRFFENTVSRPLAILRERHRVDAICNGYVERRGANNFYELVHYPKPPGHRALVPSGTASTKTGWYDPAHDILGTLKMYKKMLAAKGYKISRIITTEEIVSECLVPNNDIRAYGVMRVNAPGGQEAFELQTRTETSAVITALAAIGLPQPETYDVGYSDQLGHQPFMKERFIMVCQTGRTGEVDLGDETPLVLPNTLGYYAIGVATGQLNPGVQTRVTSHDGKDAHIYCEGWMTGGAIIQDPEAFVVLTIPSPTV